MAKYGRSVESRLATTASRAGPMFQSGAEESAIKRLHGPLFTSSNNSMSETRARVSTPWMAEMRLRSKYTARKIVTSTRNTASAISAWVVISPPQLDETALFYLRSRGVPLQEARGLLTYAFARELVGLIRIPRLKLRVEVLVGSKLPGGGATTEGE